MHREYSLLNPFANSRVCLHWLLLIGGLLALLSGCASTGGKDAASSSLPELARLPDALPKVEPKSKYGNPKSYVVFGKRYYTKARSQGHVERGLASWYGKKFHGRKTSSGERYDMYAMTAAHKTLPLPTYARVTNMTNGRSAVVKINDRGPFHGDRIIDLSYSAARKLGVVAKGTAMVEVRAIDPSRPQSDDQNTFLVSADAGSEVEAPIRSKTVAARKPSLVQKQKAVARAAGPAAKVAKVEKPRASAQDSVLTVAKTTTLNKAAEPQVVVAATEQRSRKAAGSPMYLQVGAFGSRLNAEQLRRQLVSHIAEQVQVRTINGNNAPVYKVHVGPFESRERANDFSQQLASLGLRESLIVVQ